MMKTLKLVAVLGAAGLAVGWTGNAQAQSAPPMRSVSATSRDTAPTIDTAAVNALRRMGTYLRNLTAFQIEADVTTEEVLRDGQKIQMANAVKLIASRPNKLRVELISDRKQRLFTFDGKDFTLFAPRQKFYSTVAAPGTINDLAKVLEEKYDVDLPLVDLFRWGTSDEQINAIRAAKDIGPCIIDEIPCNHYAFRQNGVDWQLWIQNGAHPLPLKVVLTTTTDDARPQHTSLYTWNLAPVFNDAVFAVKPPEDFKKIGMAEVATSRTQTPGGSKQ
jgi:hypothetical protein